MKRIRIGKDISMRWEITTDGVAIPLEGRDLTIEIKSPTGIENNIPYRVEGNILIMTYYGYEQKRPGEYSITLWEKKGKPGQNVVDVIRAFELVRTSQEENDFVGGDLQIESVDLGTENFDILTEGGYRAINIDTLQADALKDSVNINGKTYSNESFTITLPKANLDVAGVMSADDKKALQDHGNSISQLESTTSGHSNAISQINAKLDEHTESINAKISTDRIENGSVTSEKIATSAFDSTLSVSGKIAPADVVGMKLTELENEIGKKATFSTTSNKRFPFDFVVGKSYRLTNKSSSSFITINTATQATGGTTISLGSLDAGVSKEVVIDEDATFVVIKVVSTDIDNILFIEELDGIKYNLDILKTSTEKVEQELSSLDKNVDNIDMSVFGSMKCIETKNGYISGSTKLIIINSYETEVYDVSLLSGHEIAIDNGLKVSNGRVYAFLKTLDNWDNGNQPDYCDGYTATIFYNNPEKVVVPDDARYLVVTSKTSVSANNRLTLLGNLKDSLQQVSYLANSILTDVNKEDYWEQGGISAENGWNKNSDVRIRTKGTLGKTISSIKAINGYGFYIFAYGTKDKEVYIGAWNGSGFSTDPAKRCTEVDMLKMRSEYDYYFAITIINHTASKINVSDYANVKINSLYTYENTEELGNLLGDMALFEKAYLPKYVFVLSDRTLARAVTLCRESIQDNDLGIGINGKSKVSFIHKTSAQKSVVKETLRLTNKDKEKQIEVDNIILNPSLINGKVRVLTIGDSMTEGGAVNPLTGEAEKFINWAGFIHYASMVNHLQNGNDEFLSIGAQVKLDAPFTFNGEEYVNETYAEGHSGWSTCNHLFHPMWFCVYSKTNSIRFDREDAFYLLGLSTKTYFDAEGYNTTKVEFDDSQEQRVEILKAVFGRYKIDHTKRIWDKIKVQDPTFSSDEYVGTDAQKTMIDEWFDRVISSQIIKQSNPTQQANAVNRCFDINKARAYTGNHNWTYRSAFSLQKYLDQYRNLDNDGNVLVGADGASVIGVDGKSYIKGTHVSKCETCHVAEPTHVIVALGANDILHEQTEQDNVKLLLDEIKSFNSTIEVAFLMQRFLAGVFDNAEWNGVFAQNRIKAIRQNYPHMNQEMLNTFGNNLGTSHAIQYIPAYFVQAPWNNAPDTFAYDELGRKTVLQDISDDHIGWFAHNDVGQQAYAWILNTLVE